MWGVTTTLSMSSSGLSAGRRLLLEHVESRARNLAPRDRMGQRRLVDHGAPTRVDEHARGLHLRQLGSTDHSFSPPGVGDMERHHVRLPQQLVQGDAADTQLPLHLVGVLHHVVVDQLALPAPKAPGHGSTYAAQDQRCPPSCR